MIIQKHKMKETENKIEVLNPIVLFNTIGQELHDIFLANELSLDMLSEQIKVEISKISCITKLNKSQLNQVEKIIQIPEILDYLSIFQQNYLKSFKKAELSYKQNLKIYKKVKHLTPLLRNQFNEGMDLLEDIADFLNIENEIEIFDKVNENIALYKISNFEPDNLNLYAWLRRGELDFYSLKLIDYNKDLFLNWISSKEWKKNIRNTDYLKSLPNKLKSFGVGLVFTPYLNKTVFGAVRWFDGKPLIQVSDKGKCLTTIWYTLFHEFGHVIKHENDEIFEGSLDLSQAAINRKEKEANAFAYEYLFNGDGLRKVIFSNSRQSVNPEFIDDFSLKFDVDKMFVAYWMKKAQIKSYTINNNLPQLSFE